MKHPIQRMWVNQPSSSQPLHHRHGENVIASTDYCDGYYCFPLSGDTVSFHAPSGALSKGWIESKNKTFTQEEYSGLRNAFHVAMTALHYANRTPEGFHKHDKNLDVAIAEVGTIYKMVKAKGGMK